jgi:putative transposase
LGGASGISKSEMSRICQGLDEQIKAFLGRLLDHARFPHLCLDAT